LANVVFADALSPSLQLFLAPSPFPFASAWEGALPLATSLRLRLKSVVLVCIKSGIPLSYPDYQHWRLWDVKSDQRRRGRHLGGKRDATAARSERRDGASARGLADRILDGEAAAIAVEMIALAAIRPPHRPA